MGETSNRRNVLLFLAALEACMTSQGHRVPSGAGTAAAIDAYSKQ